MSLLSRADACRRRVSRHVVLGWLGVFLACAILWAGEAALRRAGAIEQLKQSSHPRRAYPLSSSNSDPLAFSKAEMQTARHVALLLGAGLWFVAAVTMFYVRPWRRQAAQVCLAGVIVAAVAWTVNPTLVWSRGRLIAPLPIGIAAAGSVSLLALMVPSRRSKPGNSTPRCAGCDYDLRGNQSGICPECGRLTPRKAVERWRDQAERLAVVTSERDPSPDSEDPQPPEWPGRFSDPEPSYCVPSVPER